MSVVGGLGALMSLGAQLVSQSTPRCSVCSSREEGEEERRDAMGLTGYLKSRGEDYTVANYRQCTIEKGLEAT
ncbi:hypothetical protein DER46DRAFT_369328 [Fusarium sp. MPI-SDFR-AT-0072]|nr:hypothetical protein DER46DRAFT_369328 [Fusarium sp. MPI-SDFR-AT-0072]